MLLSGAQWQDENLWAQTEIQEISFKHEKKLFLVIKYWNRLLTEAVEAPCIEILKT